MMRDAVVTITDVTKTYFRGPEQVHAVVGASLSLHAGEMVGLVGRSGSGKTTLLNLLAGWEQPDAGEIRWLHERDSSRKSPAWHELAIVPQSLGLMEELTVRENVELPARLRHRLNPATCERADQLLNAFGLIELADRMPDEVSIGEQQRAAVARALLLSPRIVLADEPTGHQDASWAKGVFRALQWAASSGTCCLVATHNQEVMKYFDRIGAMRDGRLEDEVVVPVTNVGDPI